MGGDEIRGEELDYCFKVISPVPTESYEDVNRACLVMNLTLGYTAIPTQKSLKDLRRVEGRCTALMKAGPSLFILLMMSWKLRVSFD